MICTKCGAQMDQTDKNTMTGRVIREYECRNCGHTRLGKTMASLSGR